VNRALHQAELVGAWMEKVPASAIINYDLPQSLVQHYRTTKYTKYTKKQNSHEDEDEDEFATQMFEANKPGETPGPGSKVFPD